MLSPKHELPKLREPTQQSKLIIWLRSTENLILLYCPLTLFLFTIDFRTETHRYDLENPSTALPLKYAEATRGGDALQTVIDFTQRCDRCRLCRSSSHYTSITKHCRHDLSSCSAPAINKTCAMLGLFTLHSSASVTLPNKITSLVCHYPLNLKHFSVLNQHRDG